MTCIKLLSFVLKHQAKVMAQSLQVDSKELLINGSNESIIDVLDQS